MNELLIFTTARKAGVNIETIRYCQRIGLAAEPEKSLSGFRVYPDSAIERIHFIQRAQRLGFSLAEVNTCSNSKMVVVRRRVSWRNRNWR